MGSVSAAHAAPQAIDPYFILADEEPTVEVIDEAALPPVLDQAYGLRPDGTPNFLFDEFGFRIFNTNPPSGLDKAEMTLDKIINMGKKIWAIVEANKPVVNLEVNTANALPLGAERWDALQGWQTPQSRIYRYTYKNLFRMKVVELSFRVLYTYGGNVDGKGRYLANVTVVPAEVNVLWGYKLNAAVMVPSVTNAGSKSDPVAGAQLYVSWRIDTVLKHARKSLSLYVDGNGTFTDLSEGRRR